MLVFYSSSNMVFTVTETVLYLNGFLTGKFDLYLSFYKGEVRATYSHQTMKAPEPGREVYTTGDTSRFQCC